jgi:hypothetical protein
MEQTVEFHNKNESMNDLLLQLLEELTYPMSHADWGSFSGSKMVKLSL